jgi:hypothetical protein
MTSNVGVRPIWPSMTVVGQSLRGSGATNDLWRKQDEDHRTYFTRGKRGEKLSAVFVDGAWHALSREQRNAVMESEQTERAPRGKSTKRPSGATRYEIDAHPAQYNTFV